MMFPLALVVVSSVIVAPDPEAQLKPPKLSVDKNCPAEPPEIFVAVVAVVAVPTERED